MNLEFPSYLENQKLWKKDPEGGKNRYPIVFLPVDGLENAFGVISSFYQIIVPSS